MKKINKKIPLIITFFLILYAKSMILTFMSSSNSGTSFYGVSFDIYLIIPHLAILGLIIFPALLFKDRALIKYLIITDILYSILLIADIWVYRGSGNILAVQYIFHPEGFNVLNRSIFNPNKVDLLYIIDIPIILFGYYKLKDKITFKRSKKTALVAIVMSALIVTSWHYLFDIKRVAGGNIRFIQEDWEASWNPSARMASRSPLGHHIYEAYTTLSKLKNKPNEEDINEINEWLEWNKEDVPDNEYKGIAKGKNVVFLQIEALEDFIINQEVYGQEVTPYMNKLVKDGLYFNNIHEQNNAGNSIDMDMMASSGVLPLGDSITYLTHPEVKYKSLPRILGENGYTSVLTHAERAGDWNWAEAGSVSAGYEELWDIREYEIDEYAGFGLSDRSLYTQFTNKISNLKEPFMAVVPTLTSHGPFDIAEKYRELDLPEELDKNRLGGYFQSIHYADKQIGLFFKLLEEKGLIDDTIVVIYGDHGGIHKYYMEDVEATDMPGDWWKENEKQIPLIIYGKDIPAKTISNVGGQIDIMPTVSYLLGVDTGNVQMGRNLLTTERDATVIKGGIVVGNPTEEEKKRLEQAYDIADKIIKNDYYVNTGKID